MLDIYLVQMEVVEGQKPLNFGKVRELTRAIRKNVFDPIPGLIVLPEMFATGYMPLHPEIMAEDFSTCDSGDTATFLSRLANDTGCTIMGGGIAIAPQTGPRPKLLNHCSIYKPGSQAESAHYDKCHPFFMEQAKFIKGESVSLFKIGRWSIAPTICFDLRFPELYRDAVKLGAQVITVQAAWPAERIEHWKILLQARAIENQVYIAAVNCVGNSKYGGCSMVISPKGDIMESADGTQNGIVHARVISNEQLIYRHKFPVLEGIVPPGIL